MKLQIGCYILTQRVLRQGFFALLLLGIFCGVLIALHEDGKSTGWLPLLPGFLVFGKLLKSIVSDFKEDNQPD